MQHITISVKWVTPDGASARSVILGRSLHDKDLARDELHAPETRQPVCFARTARGMCVGIRPKLINELLDEANKTEVVTSHAASAAE